MSRAGLHFYLLHNEHSKKGVAGYADMIFPAVVAGFLLGRIGCHWRYFKLAGFVAVFAAVLVALRTVYAKMLTEEQAWWWPKESCQLVPFLFGQTVMTLLVLTVCTYGGRLWRLEA